MNATSNPKEIRILFHEQMISSIGPSLGILFAGGLLTLSMICIFLLSPKGKEASKQQRLLRIYVVVVVAFVLAFQLLAFLSVNSPAFIDPGPKHDLPDVVYAVDITMNSLPVIVGGLIDGLLVNKADFVVSLCNTDDIFKVWRCFMVQRALGPNYPKLRAAFWIFPMSLWSTTIRMSTSTDIFYASSDTELATK